MNCFLIFHVLALQVLFGYVVEKIVTEANVIRQSETNKSRFNITENDRKSYTPDLKHLHPKNEKVFPKKHSSTELGRKKVPRIEHHRQTHPNSKYKNRHNRKHFQLKPFATFNTSEMDNHVKPLKSLQQKNESVENNKLGTTKFRKKLGEILKLKKQRSKHDSKTSGKIHNKITFFQKRSLKPVKRTKPRNNSKLSVKHKMLRQYRGHPKTTTSEKYTKIWETELSRKSTPLTTKDILSILTVNTLLSQNVTTSNIFSRETSTNTSILMSQTETQATDLSENELQSSTTSTPLKTQTQISEIDKNIAEKTANIENRDDLTSEYTTSNTTASTDLNTLNKIPMKRNTSGTIRDIQSESIGNSGTELETSIQNSIFISKSENIIKSALIKSGNIKTTLRSEIDFQNLSSTEDRTVSTFINSYANIQDPLIENSSTHNETGIQYMPEYGFVDTKSQNLLLSKSTDAERNIRNKIINQNTSSYGTKANYIQDDTAVSLENDITNTSFDSNWETEIAYEFDDSTTVTNQAIETLSHTLFKNTFKEKVQNKSEMLNNSVTESIFKKFLREINEMVEIPTFSNHNDTVKITHIDDKVKSELNDNFEVNTNITDSKTFLSPKNFIFSPTLRSKLQSINPSSPDNWITKIPRISEGKIPVIDHDIEKIPIENKMETITVNPKDVRESYPDNNIASINRFSTETQNNTAANVFINNGVYTGIAEIKDNGKNKRFINVEYGTINETKSKIEQQIVEIFEENNTASNFKNIYINVSKTDIRITVPVFKNKSFSLDGIKQQLIKLGILKEISFLREKNFLRNPFYEWIVLCFSRHTLQTAMAIGLVIFIILLIILIRWHSKRKITFQEMHEKGLRYESRSRSSTSDEFEEQSISSPEKKQKLRIIDLKQVERTSQLHKEKSLQKKLKDKSFEREKSLSSSSDDLDTKSTEIKKVLKKQDTLISDIHDDKMKSPQKKIKDMNVERDKLISTSSDDSDIGPTEIKKVLREENIPLPYIDHEVKRKKPETKSPHKEEKRTEQLQLVKDSSMSTEVKKDVQKKKKKILKPTKKEMQKPPNEDWDEEGDKPCDQKGGKFNQWMGRFFKITRPETPDDEKAGDKSSSQTSKSPSRKSSEETDKSFAFNRQIFFPFLSPSRRKKRDIFGKRRKDKYLTPSLETIVSGSDLSSEPPFPPVDTSVLQQRVVTDGDNQKIDHMLTRDDWERSFFTANEIRTIGRENLQLHQPVERREINMSKIESNRTESLGTLSRESSDQSLRDVIGKSVPKAGRVDKTPKAATVYELKTHIK